MELNFSKAGLGQASLGEHHLAGVFRQLVCCRGMRYLVYRRHLFHLFHLHDPSRLY